MTRTATVTRTTRETDVAVTLDLDGVGRLPTSPPGWGSSITSSRRLAHHALFDLEVRTDGDLEVDDHHTVEDTALVLGQAIRRGARRPCRASPVSAMPPSRWMRRWRPRRWMSGAGPTP